MKIILKITGTTDIDFKDPMNQIDMGIAFQSIHDVLTKAGIKNISVEFQQMEPEEVRE